MEISAIIPHIEALIFASEKPLSTLELVDLVNNALGFIEDRATLDQVEAAIDGIREKYSSEFYAFEMRESGGGLQFLTKKEYHKTVALLNGEKFLKRLSVAALETLAIIAYKQPITKSEIETIRGVNCDYAVQKLLEKELVIIAGRNEDAVGKPLIYTTSKSFMDYFGINSPEDLPKIREVLMEEMVEATRMPREEGAEHESGSDFEIASLVVNEQGEIVDKNFSEMGMEAENVFDVEDITEEEGASNNETISEEEIFSEEEDSSEEDIVSEEETNIEEEIYSLGEAESTGANDETGDNEDLDQSASEEDEHSSQEDPNLEPEVSADDEILEDPAPHEDQIVGEEENPIDKEGMPNDEGSEASDEQDISEK